MDLSEKLYDKYKNNPLYGRRILHLLSPGRWNGNKYDHEKDSNYGLVERFIFWLPMCHHYILVPENNTITENRNNVTLVPHPYPTSVLANRGFFDTKTFLKWFDSSKIDIDFCFVQQPELLYNIKNALQTARYGSTTSFFSFFHWIDSPKSRPTDSYPIGFYRQLEAITLSDRAYIHCDVTLDYLKLNWKKDNKVTDLNMDNLKKKISYMPMSLFFWDGIHSEELPLPKNKKILVFNHRWNTSTGIKKLIEYTEDLDRDEYVVIVTDSEAKSPKAGSPAPDWMKVKFFTRRQYKYLLENCFATMCFVDDYATWNRSVQDSLLFNTPVICYDHPIMPHIVGEDYPYYFKTKSEFISTLNKLEKNRKTFKWTLPEHDNVFEKQLIKDMIEYLPKIERESKYEQYWLYYMSKGIDYKKHLLYCTHPGLFLSNTWERIRLGVLQSGGYDDPLEKFTKLIIRPEREKEVIERIKDIKIGDIIYTPQKNKPILVQEPTKDPSFNVKKRFW